MTLLIGGASALAAVASLPRWRLSTFLTLLMDLFAAETVLFGLADIVTLLGYWPHGYEEYQLPSYLPLATALFMVVIFAVSYIPVVRKIMALADPFFDARTPISIRPWPLGPTIMRQSLYARICVFFLILVNQFQVAIGVRLNFFYRDFGNAIQVPDESHRIAFWHQLVGVFTPLVTISILVFLLEFYVVPELRAAVAALDDGLLHLALAHELDALQACAERRRHRQPRPAHLGGHRRIHQRRRGRWRLPQRRHLQLHHRGDHDGDQSGRVLDHPVGHLADNGPVHFRPQDPGPPVLGRHPLRLFRHRRDATHRPSAVGALLPPAGGRSQFPFRSRAHPRIQRADRAS